MAVLPDPVHPELATHTGERLHDRGVGLLVVFTAATLLMVAAIAAVGVIGGWWILAPVMLVDLAVTFAVVSGIRRLLSDDTDDSA